MKFVLLSLLFSVASVANCLLVPCFDNEGCIRAGSRIMLKCTVEDTANGFGGTVWSGSPSIFNCSNPNNTAKDNKIFLEHNPSTAAFGKCGLALKAKMEEWNSTHFVSILTIQNATISMNRGMVNCSFFNVMSLVDKPVSLLVEGQDIL